MKVLFQDKRTLGRESVSQIELIGLMNLLAKLSESIDIYLEFLDTEEKALLQSMGGKYPLAVICCIIVYRLDCGDTEETKRQYFEWMENMEKEH